MRNCILLVFICSICLLPVNAQKSLSIHGEKLKDGTVYLIFDSNSKTLEYFLNQQSSDTRNKINNSATFSLLKSNQCSIYLKWINPLRYSIIWKDSIYDNENVKLIKNFISAMVHQFGSPVSSLNQSSGIKSMPEGQISVPTNDKILFIPDSGFQNTALNNLYMQLSMVKDSSQHDFSVLNNFTKLITFLDSSISDNIPQKCERDLLTLLSITEPSNVDLETNEIKGNIIIYNKLIDSISKINKKIIELLPSVSSNSITNPILRRSFITTILNFTNQVSSTIKPNKTLIDKLSSLIDIMKNSSGSKNASSMMPGYYKIRNIAFDDGKVIQTTMTISKFDYDTIKKDFSEENELLRNKLIFQQYDFIAISVSTGIFYSNTTLKSFGVSDSVEGKFIVTETEINKNNPVTAFFLNFNIGFNSNYLAFLGQLGIDPTKKLPFLLAGAGFSIPCARIAISAGPLWTWNQSLDKLTVGQSISSTTDLENDIHYTFNAKPKGWYLGLQYNY